MKAHGSIAGCLVLLALALLPQGVQAQGIMISAGGPVNRSMGGASTAAPLEAIGALYWNPATTSALPTSELGFGLGLLLPVLETSSSVAGLGSGATGAEPGVTPIPNVGWVHRPEGSRITYGLGLLAVAGFNTNYPASTSNPFFAPQSNATAVPGGFGRVYTENAFLQLDPTVSVAVTDRLSVGLGPTVTMGKVIVDPLVVAAPDDADGTGVPTYPSGRGTRIHWGGGAQLGVYYIADGGWHFGSSIKSPQWMEEFRFHTEDELGRPRIGKFKIDLPMIISLGAAYSGIENIVLALDLRYFDYKNTDGLGSAGFREDGSLMGLDFSNVFALAMGAQFRLGERIYWRVGYTFNQSPLQDGEATFAVAAPLFYQHQIHTGASYELSELVAIHLAYTYYVETDLTGPILTPAGAVPGSSVTTQESVHLASLGVTVRY